MVNQINQNTFCSVCSCVHKPWCVTLKAKVNSFNSSYTVAPLHFNLLGSVERHESALLKVLIHPASVWVFFFFLLSGGLKRRLSISLINWELNWEENELHHKHPHTYFWKYSTLLWESETKGNHKIVISCFLLEIAWTSLYFPQMTYFPCHISTSTAEHGLCPCVVNKSHIFYQPGTSCAVLLKILCAWGAGVCFQLIF